MASFRTIQSQYAEEFAFDKKGVYHKGKLITADTSGFKVVGEANGHKFWKNNSHVFDNEMVLKDADAVTFEVIMCYNIPYLKDKNSVYYLNKKIKGSDPASVIRSCSGPFYDRNYIYNADDLLTYHNKAVMSVNQVFGKTDSGVIYLRNSKSVKHVDAKSLIGLSLSYSADRYHVFFDSTAFAVPPTDMTQLKVWEQVNSHFFSDGRLIYSDGALCADEVDAATFSMLPKSDICYDKNGIYYKGWDEKTKRVNFKKYPFTYNVPVTAQNTFLSSNYRFIIYSDQVYDISGKKVITGLSRIDLEKTKSMTYNYWKLSLLELLHSKIHFLENGLMEKENQMFYEGSLIQNIDVGFLSYLGNGYYKYKKQLYFFNRGSFKPFNGNVATFKTTSALTYDKNYVYLGTRPILKSKNIELLAILAGTMIGGDEGFHYNNYSLYKNYKGYWIKSTDESKISYVGKSLTRQIIKVLGQTRSTNSEKNK
ncbi:MAG: DKNYY domain-containing protein [Bacteroidota bacterium]|nr:DKNYY domain-containing protein [Bacteroidota bacterium]